jgi:hypothetical protein
MFPQKQKHIKFHIPEQFVCPIYRSASVSIALLVFCLFSFIITKQHISHTTISLPNIMTFEQEICINFCCDSSAGAAAAAASAHHRRGGGICSGASAQQAAQQQW